MNISSISLSLASVLLHLRFLLCDFISLYRTVNQQNNASTNRMKWFPRQLPSDAAAGIQPFDEEDEDG